MSQLILVALGFALFAISMIIFNMKRTKKLNTFPYNENKKPSVSLGGFSYFIFLKRDKELTIWVILTWIGLILFIIGSLMNSGVI